MKYKITGNTLVDYAVLPGAIFGALGFLANFLGREGANVLGEGAATANMGSFLVFACSVVAVIGTAYSLSFIKKSIFGIALNGAVFGLANHITASSLWLVFPPGTTIDVDAVKSFALMGVLQAIFYCILSFAGVFLWLMQKWFEAAKQSGRGK